MSVLQLISRPSSIFLLPTTLVPFRSSSSSSSLRSLAFYPPFKTSKTTPPSTINITSCSSSSSPNSLPSIEDFNDDEPRAAAMFEAVRQYENDGILPCVRTFENDLARLTIVGGVDFEQALTASAADGGDAANQHLLHGLDAMVIETVYPGPEDQQSTVNTRLFLPARKVKEKAKKLRSYLTEDILTSASPKNILAMTFRQVQVHQLWNVELVLLVPGSERDMETLDAPREVAVSFTLNSNSRSIISVVAEAICFLALEDAERNFYNKSHSQGVFNWFSKAKRISSNDSSATVYRLEEEIIKDAKCMLEKFNLVKAKYKKIRKKPRFSWWSPLLPSKLEGVGGSEFSAWASDYIPAYRLQVDADRFSSVKLKGWRRTAENKWEVLLTHSQMAGLASVLDLYMEDPYTLPDKQLSCSLNKNPKKFSSSKRGPSWLRILSTALVGALLAVSIGMLGQMCFPHLHSRRKDDRKLSVAKSSEYIGIQSVSLGHYEMVSFCTAIIEKVKSSYGWSSDINSESTQGAWIGEVPIYLRKGHESGYDWYGDESPATISGVLSENNEISRASAQDIASYQVVLSTDGKIVGFQPTSLVAVNHWAANPLSKELYGGKKLSPGMLEPWLKIHKPREVVVIELLMSVNPDTSFALARPAP